MEAKSAGLSGDSSSARRLLTSRRAGGGSGHDRFQLGRNSVLLGSSVLGCVQASYQGPALFLLSVMRQHQETGLFGRFKPFGGIILVLGWGRSVNGSNPGLLCTRSHITCSIFDLERII